MASYDRRFLVPYLQDVCSAEMLCSRLEKEIAQCNNNIQWYSKFVNQRIITPIYPNKSEYIPSYSSFIWNYVFSIVLFPIFLLGVFGTLVGCWITGLPIAFFSGIAIWSMLASIPDTIEDGKYKYNCALEEYNSKVEKNRKTMEEIPKYKEYIWTCQNELNNFTSALAKAEALRQKLYDINIIARKYRNKHVAYYLYDYFSTARENDLDKVLQTLLLDEIIERLDKIISQNEEVLLNQRYQIALDEQQNRMIAENHRRELHQIARLERNQELQLDYQNMIARNQEVTNFFLAAEYIQRLKDQN